MSFSLNVKKVLAVAIKTTLTEVIVANGFHQQFPAALRVKIITVFKAKYEGRDWTANDCKASEPYSESMGSSMFGNILNTTMQQAKGSLEAPPLL